MSPQDTKLSICVWPVLSLAEDIKRLLSYLTWHAAPFSQKISINLSAPENQIDVLPEFITNTLPGQLNPDDADHIIFWTREAFERAPGRWRKKGVSLDPFVDIAVSEDYDRFFSRFADGLPHSLKTIPQTQQNRAAIIVGTSSHAKTDLLHLNDKSAGASVIYIGSAILNAELIELLPPDWVVLADGPSQLGQLQSAKIFRQALFELMETHSKLNVLMPAHNLPAALHHWPKKYHDRLYAVSENSAAPIPIIFRRREEFRPTGNVLTGLAIPLAAHLGSRIYLAGISTQPATGKFSQYEGIERQRRLAAILALEPGSLATQADYYAQHYAALFELSRLYQAHDISVFNAKERALHTHEDLPQQASGFVFADILRFGYQHPVLIGLGLWGSVMLSLLIGSMSFGIDMVYLLATLILALTLCSVLFLRQRQNRLMSRLEHRLSKQSAAQFDNLSARLDEIEGKTLRKKK